MNLTWTDDRCIVCALALHERLIRCSKTAALTEEHLIPEAIGGRLICNFLCQNCNSQLGQIEARLKNNAGIRLAIDNLKSTLPELWATMSNNQRYVAVGPDGTLGAKLKNGEIRVNSSKGIDGSIIRPADDSARTVRTMLQRRGANQDEIANAIAKLKESPEGSRVKIADGIEVLKSTPTAIHPALNSQGIDQRALLKVAYEYLALNLGPKILHEYFDPIRWALSEDGSVPSCCRLEELRVRDPGYQPFHGLAVKRTGSGMTVTIRLFG
jgi:hypothetical protein